MTSPHAWPEEEAKALVHYWNVQHKTAGEIAKIMGKTRSAIIGKAHRMKLERRPSPIKTQPGQQAKRKKKMPIPRKHAVRPVNGSVHLLDLQAGQCRAPTWADDEKPNFAYCGHDTEGHRNYCPEHQKEFIRKTISAEDLAKADEARRNIFKRQKFVFG